MTSFFGSIRSLFKTKEKPGQPTRISKYEDEIKLLLDTGTLSLSGPFELQPTENGTFQTDTFKSGQFYRPVPLKCLSGPQ